MPLSSNVTPEAERRTSVPKPAVRSRLAIAVILGMLAVTGAGDRWLTAQIEAAANQVLPLDQPLSAVPLRLGAWQGTDEPLDEKIRRIAGDDDSLNRVYRNAENNRTIGMYIGYVGRPRKWLGHRPDICYRTHGFEQISQTSAILPLADGSTIPCFMYEFQSPRLGGSRQIVLATYLYNGMFLDNLEAMHEMNSRRVDVFKKRNTYLARIQISINATADRQQDIQLLQQFAISLQDPVLSLLPRSN